MRLPSHLSDEPTARDRGYGFGVAHKAAIENTIQVYRRMFAATRSLGTQEIERFGERVGETLAAHCPDALEEIRGLAAGAAASEDELLAINARTELLAGHTAPECSLIACDSRGSQADCLVAQTWDWHPALAASRVLWTVRQPTGSWFVTLTEAGMLGKIGLNSNRIACGLNFLTSAADGGPTGIPIHILLRLVLSDCQDLGAALHLLLNTTTSASGCITIAHADTNGSAIFSVEIAPGETAAVGTNEHGRLVHTNHFLKPPTTTTDVGLRDWPGTLIRYAHLGNRLSSLDELNEMRLRSTLASHFGAPDSVCKHDVPSDPWADRRETLAAVIVNLSTPSMAISDGPPCAAAWQQIQLPENAPSHRPPSLRPERVPAEIP